MTEPPKRIVRRVSVEFNDGSFYDVNLDMIERMSKVAEGLETLEAAILAAKRLAALK